MTICESRLSSPPFRHRNFPVVRAVALFFLLAVAVTAARADEFDTLRQYWWNSLTGGSNSSSSTLTSRANSANTYWSSMVTNAGRTNLWSDLPLGSVSANISSTFNRLKTMSLAWTSPGCSLEGNTNLAAAINGGLDWMATNIYTPTLASGSQYDNWWDWQIGGPQAFNDTVLMMYYGLTSTELTNYCSSIDHYSPPTKALMTGANLTDQCKVVLIRGIYGKSSGRMSYGQTNMSPVFLYVTTSDGFYRDGSFVQHTRIAYTGSYGTVLLNDVAQLAGLLYGSTWQITDPNFTNVFNWVVNSYEPVIYKGEMMDMVRGRAISRYSSSQASNASGAINNAVQLAQFAPAATAAAITNWAASATLPPGQYQFADMDRVVAWRSNFCFGLSMSSTRIANYESINGENLHGWFTGDGMTYLYLGSTETQFAGDFWPTVDAYHLPGTTVDTTARADGFIEAKPTSQNWVGGAQVSQSYGVAGMSLASTNASGAASLLAAKKSWFMFDNQVVCLGAGITCGATSEIDTTVEDRRLGTSPTNKFNVNGTSYLPTMGWSSNLTSASWCALDGVAGYFFPGGATNLRASFVTNTGAWIQINNGTYVGATTNLYTDDYLTLWFNHGVKPTNSTYAYVILPNYTASNMVTYAASPDIVVLTNTATVQAASKPALGLVAANFWVDGTNSADLIKVNKKSSVITSESSSAISVGVCDPTQTNTSTVTVTLNRAALSASATDAGVTVVQLSPQIVLSVNVSGSLGKTYQASFILQTSIVAAADARATAVGTPVWLDALANDTASQAGLTLAITGVTQPANGTATVTNGLIVYAPFAGFSGNDAFTYTINDSLRSATGTVSVAVGAPALVLLPAMVSASTNDGNLPVNTVDNDLNTRWSASGVGQWIQYDLLSLHRVDAVSLATYVGNTRASYFDVDTSRDGTNWSLVFTGQSSGTTTNLERFDCTNSWARYVRIVGRGNSQSAWNSYTEVNIHTTTNYPPAAVANSVTTNSAQPLVINVLANDSDADGGPQPLAVTSFTQPASGAVTATNGGLYFVPPTNYSGVANFSYMVTDGFLTSTGSVQVTVTTPLPPVLASTATYGGSRFSLSFSGSSGQSYRVLAGTNLFMPLTNWLVLTNGTFGAGVVNFTDNVATNRQKFYRVASP